MPRLSIAKEFLAGYTKLEKPVRKAVDRKISQFAQPGAGLNLEKLEAARDLNIRTIRITDFYRGVVLAPDRGDDHLLITVLPHDDAIAYATSKKFTVNQALGVLEVRNQGALDDFEPALRTVAEGTDDRLFSQVKDGDLVRLGIDENLLPLIRLLSSEQHLAAMETLLPETQYDTLVALASGYTPDEVWQQLSTDILGGDVPDTVDVDDFATAVERTPDKYLAVSGPDELADLLAHPFDTWRVFLHRSQRAVAYRDVFRGPALVKGGAGTGKTVTAVHRAAYLASKEQSTGRDILLTTFTRTLSDALEDQLGLLVDDPNIRNRIEVNNVDRLAYRIVTEARSEQPDLIGGAELQRLWKEAANSIDNHFSTAFLEREWQDVILAQQINTVDSYIATKRRGRIRSIGATQKRLIWSAISKVTSELRNNGKTTYSQIADEAATILSRRAQPPYRHILVDEGQDLHPAQWRLLRAAVAPGPNDLFIVSDPNQRIYAHQVSLSSLGIEVRGRSHTLKISYRTTQEILNWSLGVLGGTPRLGLDDAPDNLDGYRSPMHGHRPAPRSYPDRRAELDGLVNQVREWLSVGIEPSSIGIAGRTNARLKEVRNSLDEAGITHSDRKAEEAVRVATMHSMKGLEFRCMAVIGVDASDMPLPYAITPANDDLASHQLDTQRERCLLFVACTRARDMLYLSHSGAPSSFLGDD